MTENDNPGLLAAGFALGSLTPAESAEYEAYLASSAAARSEAEDFETVAAALRLDAPRAAPPASLKAKIMAQVAATPQWPASPVTDAPPAPGVQDAPASRVDPLHPAELAGPEPAGFGPVEARARSRWTRRPVLVMAAAAAATVLFAGGAVVGGAIGGGVSLQQAQSPTLAQIVSSADSQRASAPVSGGGTATLVWSAELGKSALFVDGLGALPADRAYELWYMTGETAVSAGLLQLGEGGKTWQVLDGAMKAGDTIGVTVEPRGGSTAPTTKPIVAISS